MNDHHEDDNKTNGPGRPVRGMRVEEAIYRAAHLDQEREADIGVALGSPHDTHDASVLGDVSGSAEPDGSGPVVVAGEVVASSSDDRPPVAPADVDLDPDVGLRVLVDAPAAPATAVEVWRDKLGRDRRPVVPAWVRDRSALVPAVRDTTGYYGHLTAFHATRLPLYWAKLAVRSPVGLGKLLVAAGRWVFEADQADARRQLTAHPSDTNAYLRLKQERRDTVRFRLLLLTGMAAVAGLVAAVVVMSYPWPVQAATVAVVAAVLGWYGHGDGRSVVGGRAVNTAVVPRLTADLITTALSTLGLGELNKAVARAVQAGKPASDAIGFPAPNTRDGPGWRADIDLPGGVTAGEVIDRRDRLASGLRRELGCVWPEPDHDVHTGRLVLWVGDKSLSAAGPVSWPLAKTGRVNLFEPVPLGTDQRGRPVTVTLMYASGLIGAIPRMGKTFFLRLIELAAGLDPRCEVYVYDLKGLGDHDSVAEFAHSYRAGDTDEDIAALLADTRALKEDLRRRGKTLRELPKEVCPESKTTDDLASRRGLGLHPILFAVDECQLAFEHPVHGKEIAENLTDLAKRGPAAGIMVWLATQRVDAQSIPTGISANAVLRLCLKVMGQIENDMVLGTSMYKTGVRATMFGRKDRGVAFLAGEGDDPVIVRGAYVDAPAAQTIAARARALRVKLGLLTGMAAGEAPVDPDTGSILDHLHQVWPAESDGSGVAKLWCDELADRLVGGFPDLYAGWTGAQVTAAVKPHGLKTVQVKRMVEGQQVNKRGLTRTSLTVALGYRNDPPPVTEHGEDNDQTGDGAGGEGGSGGPDPDPG
ncbi:MAG: cell division protein FtsK [Nocardioides sp.]